MRPPNVSLYLLVNDDVIPHFGSVSTLADCMETIPKVGVVAPSLIGTQGESQHVGRRFPSLTTEMREVLIVPGRWWIPRGDTLSSPTPSDRRASTGLWGQRSSCARKRLPKSGGLTSRSSSIGRRWILAASAEEGLADLRLSASGDGARRRGFHFERRVYGHAQCVALAVRQEHCSPSRQALLIAAQGAIYVGTPLRVRLDCDPALAAAGENANVEPPLVEKAVGG